MVVHMRWLGPAVMSILVRHRNGECESTAARRAAPGMAEPSARAISSNAVFSACERDACAATGSGDERTLRLFSHFRRVVVSVLAGGTIMAVQQHIANGRPIRRRDWFVGGRVARRRPVIGDGPIRRRSDDDGRRRQRRWFGRRWPGGRLSPHRLRRALWILGDRWKIRDSKPAKPREAAIGIALRASPEFDRHATIARPCRPLKPHGAECRSCVQSGDKSPVAVGTDLRQDRGKQAPRDVDGRAQSRPECRRNFKDTAVAVRAPDEANARWRVGPARRSQCRHGRTSSSATVSTARAVLYGVVEKTSPSTQIT